ncbi:MAG: hypothetical protein ABSA53_40335 [Streptosporangiaceae bacterium]
MHLAFVHGMDASLSVSAGIAFAGVLLTLIFLPRVKLPDQHEKAITEEATVDV